MATTQNPGQLNTRDKSEAKPIIIIVLLEIMFRGELSNAIRIMQRKWHSMALDGTEKFKAQSYLEHSAFRGDRYDDLS
jgi:hypothetical protein